MAARTPTGLIFALGLTLAACGAGAGSMTAPPSGPPSPTPAGTAAATATPKPSPTAVPAPTFPANAMDLPHFSALAPGTYFVEPEGTEIQVFYTIATNGWFSWFGAGNGEDGLGLSILNVTNLVGDGCTNHAGAYPRVGPTVDDMATALAALKPFEVLEPPTAVTAFGFNGKHLKWAVPDIAVEVKDDGNVFTDCLGGELWSWIGPPLGFAYYGYSEPGQTEEFWLLDVEGQRLMIVAGRSPGSSEAALAELDAILASIEIVP